MNKKIVLDPGRRRKLAGHCMWMVFTDNPYETTWQRGICPCSHIRDVKLCAGHLEVRGQNRLYFELFCMSSLSESLKTIHSKKASKCDDAVFFHYNSMIVICCHGIQSSENLCSLPPSQLCLTWNSIVIGLQVSDISVKVQTHTHLDGRRLEAHTISAPCDYSAKVS